MHTRFSTPKFQLSSLVKCDRQFCCFYLTNRFSPVLSVSTGVWEEGLSASDLSAPKVDVAKELEKSPKINSSLSEYEKT